jgi:hypothetical protein
MTTLGRNQLLYPPFRDYEFGTSSFIFIKNTAQSGKNCGEKIVLGQYRIFAKFGIFKNELIFTSKSCDQTEAACSKDQPRPSKQREKGLVWKKLQKSSQIIK